MKPFNLEEHLKNPLKKLVTRGGNSIKRILCTDARGDYPIIALVDCGSFDNALAYTKDGKFYASDEPSVNDLFFTPEEHEKWINIYRDTTGVSSGAVLYDSQEEAEEVGKSYHHYVATAKVEWEE